MMTNVAKEDEEPAGINVRWIKSAFGWKLLKEAGWNPEGDEAFIIQSLSAGIPELIWLDPTEAQKFTRDILATLKLIATGPDNPDGTQAAEDILEPRQITARVYLAQRTGGTLRELHGGNIQVHICRHFEEGAMRGGQEAILIFTFTSVDKLSSQPQSNILALQSIEKERL